MIAFNSQIENQVYRKIAETWPGEFVHRDPVPGFIVDLIDNADRFLSCVFIALTVGWKEYPGFNRSEYDCDVMPTVNHTIVMRVLSAFHERSVTPTTAHVREVANLCGFVSHEKILNFYNRDLIDDLPVISGSAGLLDYHYDEVVRLTRKCNTAARLWRKMKGLIDG